MASGGGNSLVTVTINYEASRTVLHLPKNIKIGHAIVKAAEAFKVKPEGLTFLYHGNEITDDMLVGDALAKAGNVTVIHLISFSQKKGSTAKLLVNDGKQRENVYAFCKKCSALTPARELFTCKDCGQCGAFQRSSAEPLDHFACDIPAALLRGSCGACGKENAQANVEFQCTSCTGTVEKVCPLRQVRDNLHNLPCMKCGLKKDPVFRFACSSRHTMCLDCFGNMCKQMLGAEKFRHFDQMGFNIPCPGPGDDCKHTPVPDPHHFRVVDEDQTFYGKFIKMSGNSFTPAGGNILCRCKTEIDVSDSREETVTEPEGASANVSGLKWYHKLFGIKPAPPTPRMRRRTSCRKCDVPYCIGCKQVWHEGDCAPVDKDRQREESAFPIDPVKAKSSCWPQDHN